MGADHAQILAEELPNATLEVICDMDETRARCVADR
jgi:myo-inositol 2-dehydrogenase/D-chiro-inositol 1-dehydrogenase